MSDIESSERGWSGRVEFSDEGGGFAYRPDEIIVAGQRGVDAVNARHPSDSRTTEPGGVAGALGRRVLVLDTGFAEDNLRPGALASVQSCAYDREGPDEDNDHYLDPAAGHGTFIAGIIEQLAPGCAITVEKVLTT